MQTSKHLQAAIFLDRDGTLNMETGFLYRWQDFKWLPGVKTGLKLLQQAGYKLIIVTNQSGIARGLYTLDDVKKLHTELNDDLKKCNLHIDDFFVCPHHPEFSIACNCRKPLPGMLFQAAQKYNLDLPGSWMIGDKASDAQAGLAAGCRSILVLTGYGQQEMTQVSDSVLIAADFADACNIILKQAMT